MSQQRSGTTDKIIEAAEKRMRDGGFHGVSFREIASDVGIRSASVHHHFPTKEDLGAAVATAYTERFMAALGDPSDTDRKPSDLLKLYVDQFRQALLRDHRMCLCGVLASEMTSLPGDVVHASQAFFEQNLNWLEVVLRRQFPRMSRRKRRGEAVRILALLEGAMVVAKGTGNDDAFELVAAGINE